MPKSQNDIITLLNHNEVEFDERNLREGLSSFEKYVINIEKATGSTRIILEAFAYGVGAYVGCQLGIPLGYSYSTLAQQIIQGACTSLGGTLHALVSNVVYNKLAVPTSDLHIDYEPIYNVIERAIDQSRPHHKILEVFRDFILKMQKDERKVNEAGSNSKLKSSIISGIIARMFVNNYMPMLSHTSTGKVATALLSGSMLFVQRIQSPPSNSTLVDTSDGDRATNIVERSGTLRRRHVAIQR